MSIILFDVEEFRENFVAFANETTYPDDTLQRFWDVGTNYISNDTYGCLTESERRLALDLMTAHLTALSTLILSGQMPYVMQSATIDKVSIGLKPPPTDTNEWRWWLNTTPYGMQLLALLEVNSVGGMYIGGLPEVSVFRRVGGF